jgi:hypothetical protein
MNRAFRKLLKRIAPDGMSPEEYVVRCAINNVQASPDDPTFVGWLIDESAHEVEGCDYDDVGGMLCEMIEAGRLLDFKKLSGENDARMASTMADAVLWPNKTFKEGFFEAVLHAAPRESETWKAAYRLNRAFGFTSVCYFRDEDGNPSDGIRAPDSGRVI